METSLLSIHTSNRLDLLFEHLASQLAEEPLAPLEKEIIVVQSQGMSRWLTLRLATRLGIAAGLSMPFPSALCHQLADQIRADEAEQRESKSSPSLMRQVLAWQIFDDLGREHPGGRFPTLYDYLIDDRNQLKRYQLAVRLARLFDDYQLFRADMLLAWEKDQRAGEQQHSIHEAWQADLWRRLIANDRSRPEPYLDNHLARRVARLLHLLKHSDAPPEGLPQRLTVFGVSSLPPIFLQLITALARWIPVSIYFTSPTYHYWSDLRSPRETVRLRRRIRLRQEPLEHHIEQGHPLLALLGRQGREFFALLQEADTEGAAWHELEFSDPGEESLLQLLQSDILHLVDRGGRGAPPHRLAAADDSFRVHACHSPRREMEVLRDLLLDAFERDPTLKPSDVLVMMPVIDDYSPYIEAVFGVDWDNTPAIPFAIADRLHSQDREPGEILLTLFDLAAGRVTPHEVLDLLEAPAVRRAFNLNSAEIPLLRQWVLDTRIRWGIDGKQRVEDLDLPLDEVYTWRGGIDRLLMGYASGDFDGLLQSVAPSAGATTGQAELLGRFVDFLEILFDQLRRLRSPRSPRAWVEHLTATLELIYKAQGDTEERAHDWMRSSLAEIGEAAEQAGLESAVERDVMRSELLRLLHGEGFGTGFISGRVTFCALKPMRSIPYRLICVSGLSEGAFPRRETYRSFDLIARHPRRGDRSLREDDRYLFLETLLSARERLILTYQGRSPRANRPQLPAVVVSELLETIDRSFVGEDSSSAREVVVVEHPLQPFSSRYFDPSEPRLFSYSQENHPSPDASPNREELFFYADESLTTDHGLLVDLDDLIDFWIKPSRHFCQKVLQLGLESDETLVDDAEPFSLDLLERYKVSQWLLQGRLAGRIDEEELDLLRARGELPLAGVGRAHYESLRRRVDDFADSLPEHHATEPATLELVGEGWSLQGRVDELTNKGLLRFRCANIKPKDLIRVWITHLALFSSRSHGGSTEIRSSEAIGTDRRVRFGAVGNAPEILESLMEGFRAGSSRPLPFFENASHAFVVQERKGRRRGNIRLSPQAAARRAWEGDRVPGDKHEPYTALCFRDRDPLSEHEFGVWARLLWEPLLDHAEEVSMAP